MNHYIDLNIMDTHSNYCDVKKPKNKKNTKQNKEQFNHESFCQKQ